MRLLTAFVLLYAFVFAGGSSLTSKSLQKINRGWGCGGNCAVNISGGSETVLKNNPPSVHLTDHGTLDQKQTDPSGSMINTKRWNYTFHGTSTDGNLKREFDLETDRSECTRTFKTLDAEGIATMKKADCPALPKRWKLACDRKDIEVNAKSRPAWVCSPSERLEASGTEFPWVFGIEAPITTVISGEPHPHTSYE
jgi:hypothetical protein